MRNLLSRVYPVAVTLLAILAGPTALLASEPIQFKKVILTDRYYCDGIHAGDINRDGLVDVVAGPYWYEGPGFSEPHEFYPAKSFPPEASPTDSMYSFVHDFNGDTWPDILVLGRVHLHPAYWYENPRGKPGLWEKHFVFERVQGESPPFTDVDGDGKPELVGHWKDQWGLIQPDWSQPEKPWRFRPVTEKGTWHHFYHGEGIGDVDGDGKADLILNEGWYEQPSDPQAIWRRHPFRFAAKGGAQMFTDDIDGDGDRDVITALDAHGWGLAWFEQSRTNGARVFKEQLIMGDRSLEAKLGAAFTQPHAIAVADLNGDGLTDIVTGKRRWAHGPKGDIEPEAAPVLYWFRAAREGHSIQFVPEFIDDQSGVGVQVTVTDVNGDGRPDVLSASKLGAFVFLNKVAE